MAREFKPVSLPNDVIELLEKLALQKVNGAKTIAPTVPKMIEYLAKKEAGIDIKLIQLKEQPNGNEKNS